MAPETKGATDEGILPAAKKFTTRVMVARREFVRSEAMASLKWAGRELDGPPAEREWKEWSAARVSVLLKV